MVYSASCRRLHFVLSCLRNHQEADLPPPCSLRRQRSADPSPPNPSPRPKCLGSKHDVTHMALTLSHDLEQPRQYLFSAPLPSGHGLRRWAVLCKYDLVGVNVDPGCMALQHVPGPPVNNSLQNCEDSKFGFPAMTIRPCCCFNVFDEKL